MGRPADSGPGEVTAEKLWLGEEPYALMRLDHDAPMGVVVTDYFHDPRYDAYREHMTQPVHYYHFYDWMIRLLEAVLKGDRSALLSRATDEQKRFLRRAMNRLDQLKPVPVSGFLKSLIVEDQKAFDRVLSEIFDAEETRIAHQPKSGEEKKQNAIMRAVQRMIVVILSLLKDREVLRNAVKSLEQARSRWKTDEVKRQIFAPQFFANRAGFHVDIPINQEMDILIPHLRELGLPMRIDQEEVVWAKDRFARIPDPDLLFRSYLQSIPDGKRRQRRTWKPFDPGFRFPTDIREGGASVMGIARTPFMLIADSVDRRKVSDLELQLSMTGRYPGLRTLTLPAGWSTFRFQGKNYLIENSHLDNVMGFIPKRFTNRNANLMLVDPLYYEEIKDLPAFRRFVAFQGLEIVLVDRDETHYNPANFAALSDDLLFFNYCPETLRKLNLKPGLSATISRPEDAIVWAAHFGGSVGCLIGHELITDANRDQFTRRPEVRTTARKDSPDLSEFAGSLGAAPGELFCKPVSSEGSSLGRVSRYLWLSALVGEAIRERYLKDFIHSVLESLKRSWADPSSRSSRSSAYEWPRVTRSMALEIRREFGWAGAVGLFWLGQRFLRATALTYPKDLLGYYSLSDLLDDVYQWLRHHPQSRRYISKQLLFGKYVLNRFKLSNYWMDLGVEMARKPAPQRLVLISILGYPTGKVSIDDLAQFHRLLRTFTKDPHPKVAQAAVKAIVRQLIYLSRPGFRTWMRKKQVLSPAIDEIIQEDWYAIADALNRDDGKPIFQRKSVGSAGPQYLSRMPYLEPAVRILMNLDNPNVFYNVFDKLVENFMESWGIRRVNLAFLISLVILEYDKTSARYQVRARMKGKFEHISGSRVIFAIRAVLSLFPTVFSEVAAQLREHFPIQKHNLARFLGYHLAVNPAAFQETRKKFLKHPTLPLDLFGFEISVVPSVIAKPVEGVRAGALNLALLLDQKERKFFEERQGTPAANHVFDVFAYIRFYVEGDTLVVAELQSDQFGKFPRDARWPLRYKDWMKIEMLALEDYARRMGFKRILYPHAEYQFRRWPGNPQTGGKPMPVQLAEMLYKDLPPQVGFRSVSLEKPQLIENDLTVSEAWVKEMNPGGPENDSPAVLFSGLVLHSSEARLGVPSWNQGAEASGASLGAGLDELIPVLLNEENNHSENLSFEVFEKTAEALKQIQELAAREKARRTGGSKERIQSEFTEEKLRQVLAWAPSEASRIRWFVMRLVDAFAEANPEVFSEQVLENFISSLFAKSEENPKKKDENAVRTALSILRRVNPKAFTREVREQFIAMSQYLDRDTRVRAAQIFGLEEKDLRPGASSLGKLKRIRDRSIIIEVAIDVADQVLDSRDLGLLEKMLGIRTAHAQAAKGHPLRALLLTRLNQKYRTARMQARSA